LPLKALPSKEPKTHNLEDFGINPESI